MTTTMSEEEADRWMLSLRIKEAVSELGSALEQLPYSADINFSWKSGSRHCIVEVESSDLLLGVKDERK